MHCNDDEIVDVYFKMNFLNSAISLGNYIIMDYNTYYVNTSDIDFTLNHEHGHQIQSKYFGWFYLLLVGLPSLFNNIWDRLFHKEWTHLERHDWYHSRYPENYANELAGIKYC